VLSFGSLDSGSVDPVLQLVLYSCRWEWGAVRCDEEDGVWGKEEPGLRGGMLRSGVVVRCEIVDAGSVGSGWSRGLNLSVGGTSLWRFACTMLHSD
jgi:hypothetical protein